ncbi:MAG: M1 family metallopeptidase [Acidimicrobiales bacterium]
MSSPQGQAGSGAPGDAFRLPRSVRPNRYDLTIDIDLASASFSGHVETSLSLDEDVETIVMNAADLTISNAWLTARDERVPAAVDIDESTERAAFGLAKRVGTGDATLSCDFSGALNDKLRGLYRSTFVDSDGATRTIATTQMEAADARRAFPCFDEPDRKAVFAITLIVDDELEAFSNSPVEATTHLEGGRKKVTFAPTMVMSSYLVALIVGPFEATTPRDVDGTPVRVVHVPGKSHLTNFALVVADHALRFFSSYFAIPYPGQKLDLVAIPDFAFGAMENLGCVTFRETALLVDEDAAARNDLERIADVVSHEIAHMWFGDLVTMGWWEGIWLNEAFATFMEILAVNAFRPAWERWTSFGLEREAALAVDGLHSTRPIEYPVGSPQEAEGMFDVLTYQKGGSVLRMLEQYLGEDTFRDGVRRYLSTHSYSNTKTSDLWDALEQVSGQPVRSVMDTWILQGGHPLVQSDGSNVSQSAFSYGEAANESSIGSRWSVPLLLRSIRSGETASILLTEQSAPLPDLKAPVLVSSGGWGVYRTGYGPRELAQLAQSLGSLSALERANLFADTWALVLAGQRHLETFLSLAAALGDDDEPSTFTAVAGALGLVNRALRDEARGTLAAAVQTLLGPRFESLGWEAIRGEPERIPNLRSVLLTTLGTIGRDEALRTEATKRFDSAAGGGAALDPNLQGAVLAVVADCMRAGDYETFLSKYRSAKTPQEEQRYLSALTGFPDIGLGLRTFELAMGDFRTQDAPYVIVGLLGNRVSGPAVFGALSERWQAALDRFPQNSHARMLQGVRVMCSDESIAREVTDFLVSHPITAGRRSVEQALERLWINVGFVQRERPSLVATLERVVAGAH